MTPRNVCKKKRQFYNEIRDEFSVTTYLRLSIAGVGVTSCSRCLSRFFKSSAGGYVHWDEYRAPRDRS